MLWDSATPRAEPTVMAARRKKTATVSDTKCVAIRDVGEPEAFSKRLSAGQTGAPPRSVTRDCRARERGHRLRFDSAPLDTIRERPTRVAPDGGTRLGGAESKRRRRPRLPAPPSRVTP